MKSTLPYMPDRHLIAIAHVAIRAAQLDSMIELTAYVLMGNQKATGKLLLKKTHANDMVTLVGSLLLDLFPDQQQNIDRMLGQITHTRGERHVVMHYLWGQVDEKGAATAASLRPHREENERTFTAEQLETISDTLLDASLELGKWMDRYHELRKRELADKKQLLTLRYGPGLLAPQLNTASPPQRAAEEQPQSPKPQLAPSEK